MSKKDVVGTKHTHYISLIDRKRCTEAENYLKNNPDLKAYIAALKADERDDEDNGNTPGGDIGIVIKDAGRCMGLW